MRYPHLFRVSAISAPTAATPSSCSPSCRRGPVDTARRLLDRVRLAGVQMRGPLACLRARKARARERGIPTCRHADMPTLEMLTPNLLHSQR